MLFQFIVVLQLVEQFLDGLVTFPGILLGALADDLHQPLGHLRSDLPDILQLVRRFTGVMPGQQVIQCHAQAVNVRSRIRLSHPSKLFRRSIAVGSQAGGILPVFLFILSCRAEIDQGDGAVWAQHDVGRL